MITLSTKTYLCHSHRYTKGVLSAMLNAGFSAGYKTLAKKVQKTECLISDNPVSELIIDFRSRLFRYIRLVYPSRTAHKRACSVFRTIEDLSSTDQVLTEKRRVFMAALDFTGKEVEYAGVSCMYVFSSRVSCPYKTDIKANRKTKTDERLKELKSCIAVYKKDMLRLDALEKCAKALESYIMSDLDGVAAAFYGKEWMLNVGRYRVPNEEDFFESDRMCVKLARLQNATVLSEDLDNITLFGCDMMIMEIHTKFFVYATLKDIMALFGSVNRVDTIYKSCLMGTDYNRGLKGIGPVKVKQIDETQTKDLFKTCMASQSMNHQKLMQLFM